MRGFWRSSGQTFAIGGLNASILLYLIYLLLILLYASFDIKPFYHSGRAIFGLLDFEKGIPINVSFNAKPLPDRSIHLMSSRGSVDYDMYNSSPDRADKIALESALADTLVYADTISTNYSIEKHAEPVQARNNDCIITGTRFDKGVINIETENKRLRLLCILPRLLGGIIIVCCMWQISGLLQSISKGIAFQKVNLKRLQITGALIIIYQTALFILSSYHYYNFHVAFSSSIPHFRSPITFDASPDYAFSLLWLITGTSLFIISSAFKRGIDLQEEQDLTI